MNTRSIFLIPLALAVAGCEPEAASVETRAPSSQTFREAVEAVIPAVVYIQVEARPVSLSGMMPPIPGIPEPMPGHPPLPDAPPLPEAPPDLGPSIGAGSGVIVSPSGYILTSDHVIQQASRVRVTLHDRRQFEAEVVARDPSTDVAVLRIEANNLPVATMGDSETLALGDWVLALGSPLGLQFSVTAGVVSAVGRAIGILSSSMDGEVRTAPLEHFIQTDAAINPGNSGGPLVNLEGQVVGINTAIASPTGFFSGYGFAVPINLARRVAAQLIEFGEVRRAFLGVVLGTVGPADAVAFQLESTQGAAILSVEPGSPAAEAGLELGDVIVGVGDEEVGTVSDLQAILAGLEPGSTAELRVIRYGEAMTIPVRLGMIRSGVRPDPPEPEGPARVGFAIAERGGQLIVAGVQPYSAAARSGIRTGQVILQVNRNTVRTVDDFTSAVRAARENVLSIVVDDPQIGRTIINYELRP